MHLKIGYHFINKYNVSSMFSFESVQKQCKYCLTLVSVLFWRANIKIYLKSCNILKNALEASYFSVFVVHFQWLVAVFKILLWNLCKKYFYLYAVVEKWNRSIKKCHLKLLFLLKEYSWEFWKPSRNVNLHSAQNTRLVMFFCVVPGIDWYSGFCLRVKVLYYLNHFKILNPFSRRN